MSTEQSRRAESGFGRGSSRRNSGRSSATGARSTGAQRQAGGPAAAVALRRTPSAAGSTAPARRGDRSRPGARARALIDLRARSSMPASLATTASARRRFSSSGHWAVSRAGKRLVGPAPLRRPAGRAAARRGASTNTITVAERRPSRPRAGSPRRARPPGPRRRRHRAGDRLLERPPHPRVEDRLQVACRAAGSANTIAPSARRSIRGGLAGVADAIEDSGAEPLDDPVADRALVEQRVTDRVGVDHERRRCRPAGAATAALAGADPADQPDHGDRPVLPGAGGRGRGSRIRSRVLAGM